jgi:hypothetical protein
LIGLAGAKTANAPSEVAAATIPVTFTFPVSAN